MLYSYIGESYEVKQRYSVILGSANALLLLGSPVSGTETCAVSTSCSRFEGMMPMKHFRAAALGATSLVSAALLADTATAHPHVFVTTEATVVFEKDTITAIDHVWTFDEFYTSTAIDGLDTNNDGKYSREELAELAKTNMDGLKEFGYFSFVKLGDAELKLGQSTTYYLEHKNNLLSLHFRLPLESPVLTEAKGFNFAIYDPSYFIGFDMVAKDPVKLGEGAPKGCTINVGVPEQEAAENKKLTEAFGGQTTGANLAFGAVKTAMLTCK
jgi:ABC-type uncharacterized transport system substrate-binding protein